MRNLFKSKNIKISIFSFLILNQFLLSANSLNLRKTDLEKLNGNNFKEKGFTEYKIVSDGKTTNENQDILNDAIEIEEFIEETFGTPKFENIYNLKEEMPIKNQNPELIENELNNYSFENNESTNKEKKQQSKNENKKINIKNNKRNDQNKLPLPAASNISSSEFNVPSRGYVKLRGPKITLNLQNADLTETLKLIGKLGDYGIVIIDDSGKEKITADFNEVDISNAFNSILLSADLQAIIENDIIFVGKDILNKSLKPKISKTYRLNQVNAASVADYLSTLGAIISKVMLVSGSAQGSEVNDTYVNKKEFGDGSINSYGIAGGPLLGLFGTADLRLQTITLIGSKDLIETAEKYIKSLDLRHRQVALTIKIIDVNLTKNDIKNNLLELRTGKTRIIGNTGLAVITGNQNPPYIPPETASVPSIFGGDGISQPRGNFQNWLEAKITNENAKILASPTLILGENENELSSGAADAGSDLNSPTIGRPFKNEGFVKVGETVVTNFERTIESGAVVCTATTGTAGVTFGAKVEKIDDDGYVTFALSPAISSVTKTYEIEGCGIINTLSVRKLDTGTIRVKNGNTLILTGVLQDSDNITTSKVPILGDIPILGSLFRSSAMQKRKSELIILVTPEILKDS